MPKQALRGLFGAEIASALQSEKVGVSTKVSGVAAYRQDLGWRPTANASGGHSTEATHSPGCGLLLRQRLPVMILSMKRLSQIGFSPDGIVSRLHCSSHPWR